MQAYREIRKECYRRVQMLHPKTTKLSKSNPSNEFIDHTCSQVQLQHHQLEFVKHKENGHENSLTINLL